MSTGPWLAPFTWEVVVAQNAILCQARNALHKPTSTGYEQTKALWESLHLQPMRLDESVDLCRRCHRKAPFCFYNGNTFSSIMLLVIKRMNLPEVTSAVVRSLAGHIVAGVSTAEEQAAFRKFCDSLDAASG